MTMALATPQGEALSQGLQIFDFHGNKVRTVIKDGEPWFVAADVATLLGYSRPREAVQDHCKGCAEMPLPSSGGPQMRKIIPERDVYRLIMRSKMPAAEEFEEWVVSEVLPSIRKTGSYNVQTLVPQTLPEALRAYAATLEEKEVLALQVQTLAPKAEFCDRVSDSTEGQSIGDIAKVLGTGRTRMFAWLRSQGILMESNLPYQEHIDAGRFRVIVQTPWKDANGYEHVPTKTLVTGKGLIYIQRLWDSQHGKAVNA